MLTSLLLGIWYIINPCAHLSMCIMFEEVCVCGTHVHANVCLQVPTHPSYPPIQKLYHIGVYTVCAAVCWWAMHNTIFMRVGDVTQNLNVCQAIFLMASSLISDLFTTYLFAHPILITKLKMNKCNRGHCFNNSTKKRPHIQTQSAGRCHVNYACRFASTPWGIPSQQQSTLWQEMLPALCAPTCLIWAASFCWNMDGLDKY